MKTEKGGEQILKGTGISPGFAIGPAYLFARDAYQEHAIRHIGADQVELEKKRFERAVAQSEKELRKITDVAREKIGDSSADIFQAQAMMLRDVALYQEVLRKIEHELVDSSCAVQQVLKKHRIRMEGSGSDYLRERAEDLADLQSRLQRNLQRGRILSRIETDSVVIAENLTASDVILFSRRSILGCAMDFGGLTSHVALIARSLGIPAVFGLHEITQHAEPGDQVIIDGLNGQVILRPEPQTLAVYQGRFERYKRLRAEQESLVPLSAETLDGTPVCLMANVEVEEEFPAIAHYGAQGIGLFRTEMLFLARGRFPEEDEQYDAYTKAIDHARPYPTTFRLFDLGGDKVLPLAHREHNPFLGWRGIRILLQKPDLLRTQVRAILKASAAGPSRILLPMITSLREIHDFRRHLDHVVAELAEAGIPHDPDIPVGIMVEVPSVALLIEEFAREVDFFSIGTNDLTQYVLAVDRGNDMVASLYEELHPSVLRLIERVIRVGNETGVEVSICGEMAAQPRAAPVLLGLGLRVFSVSPAYLLDVKRVIRAITIGEAEGLADDALKMQEADEVEGLVRRWLRDHACDPGQLLDLVDT